MNLLEESGDQPEFEADKNYVQELVGEGKKFKSIEDLAKGKITSDSYIKVMERQQDELRKMYLKEREENIARAKIEDLLNQSKELTSNNNPVKEVPPTPVDIDSLLDKKLSERERERIAQDNFKTVQSKLKEVLGNNYQESLKEKMQDLDLNLDYVNDLARKSPKALFKTLGIDEAPMKDSFRAPPRSSNTFSPTGEKKRTWAYYQEMKKTDPLRYASRETNIQIQKDYIADPEGFSDGDFNRYS